MKRWVFNALCRLSLLAFLAIASLAGADKIFMVSGGFTLESPDVTAISININDDRLNIERIRAPLLELSNYLLIPAMSVLPTLWLLRYRRRRKAQRAAALGRCVCCDYDLRFSAIRCPECGSEIAKGVY